MPTSGVRPQSAINDQLVDRCDILVGIFWTKLGTSTAEEIDRFVAAGKPAMLYFSRRKISTGKVDLKQAAKLSKFKATTYKRPTRLLLQVSTTRHWLGGERSFLAQ
jgi:hypothetical protein